MIVYRQRFELTALSWLLNNSLPVLAVCHPGHFPAGTAAGA
jgi:hypothetical protein